MTKASKNIIFLTFLVVLILNLQSCIEDAIDVDIPSRITSQNFPETEGDLRAILTGVYSQIRNEYNTSLYGEDRGDALDVGVIGTVSDSWAQNLNAGNAPSWQDFFNIITNANIIIERSNSVSFNSEATRLQILGEAYFIRAFIYFQMAKIWGDVPLIIEPVDQNSTPVARSEVTTVIESVLSDLSNAIDNLPNGFSSKYSPSLPAAYALLADVHMWKATVLNGGEDDYLAAINAIDQINGVRLLDNFADIFDIKENDEVIFSIFLDLNEQAGMYGSRVTSGDVNVDPVLNPDVPTSTSFNARANYKPSDFIINLFDEPDNRSVRTYIPILQLDGDDLGVELDTLTFAQNKFKGTNFNNDTFYDNDLIVYRWADMLLLRAEAYVGSNQIPAAIDDLNVVRLRAGLPSYDGPNDRNTVAREILDERGRELFLELKRYWDLVRADAVGTIDIYQQVPNLSGLNIPLVWPVSNNVIAQNELIEQNEGY